MRICLHDRTRIESFLRRDPGLYLYLLGDLADFFWLHTSWYGWQGEQGLDALALVYSGDELPVLLAFAEPGGGMERLLASLAGLLPMRFYSHLSPELAEGMRGFRRLSGGEKHYRMVLRRPELLDGYPCPEAVGLDESDLPAIEALYAEAYPQNWFNPRMLATGRYVGIYEGPRLMAVAGVHVYAPEQGVAALGNIAVHPGCRERGYGTRLTAELCRRLQADTALIGLNVHAENAAALRCYAKLGFEIHAEYQEWMTQELAPGG